MAYEDYEPKESSRKKSSAQDVLDYIPDWVPGVGALREQKKRIEGKSKSKTKKESGLGGY